MPAKVEHQKSSAKGGGAASVSSSTAESEPLDQTNLALRTVIEDGSAAQRLFTQSKLVHKTTGAVNNFIDAAISFREMGSRTSLLLNIDTKLHRGIFRQFEVASKSEFESSFSDMQILMDCGNYLSQNQQENI